MELDNRFIGIRNGVYWLNDDLFDSKIAFTDENSKLYYAVKSEDKIVSYGILNGFLQDGYYRYRFDFGQYIKVFNQSLDNFRDLGTMILVDNKNSTNITLYLGLSNIVNDNLINESLIRNPDGSITGNPSDVYDSVIARFVSNNGTQQYNAVRLGSRYAFTAYRLTVVTIGNAQYNITPVTGYNCVTALINIPLNVTRVLVDDIPLVIKEPTCKLPYYYFNKNGMLDTIYFEGTRNIVETVTKVNETIDGKVLTISAKRKSQVKQNTGLSISAEQMYGVVNAICLYQYDNKFNKYYINDSSFSGYNGKNISQRNIELTLEYDEDKTIYTAFKPTFII